MHRQRLPRLYVAVLIVAMAGGVPVAAQTPAKRLPVFAPPAPPAAAVVVATPPRTGILVPQATIMRPMTPAEAQANAVWNLRAGLNVAALQCQYSPYLATVRSYNDLLKHHSAELAAAQATMMLHFKRYDGTRALNSFDQYTTRTYNSYSTLDAQYAFCNASSEIGRGALMIAKGKLGLFALAQTPVLRASLTPVVAASLLLDLVPITLPPIES